MASFVAVTLNDNGGSGGAPASFYCCTSSSSRGYFRSKSTSYTNAVYNLDTLPTRKYFAFEGYWTTKTGGDRIISKIGYVSQAQPYPAPTAALTLYARWTRISWPCTFDTQSGTGGTATLYGAVDGGWFTDWKCTTEASGITPTTRAGYIFVGYFASTNGAGTQYVNADGSFVGAFTALTLAAAKTVYAAWEKRVTVSVDADGGTVERGTVYFVPAYGKFYADTLCTEEVTGVGSVLKQSAIFLGLFDGDARATDENGEFVETFGPSDDVTLDARWRTVVDISLEKGDGDGGDGVLQYDSSDGEFHRPGEQEPIGAVDKPHVECFRFNGYFSAASGGTQYIASDGEILPALRSMEITSAFTIYAQYQRVSRRANIDVAGGDTSSLTFYSDGEAFFSDDECYNQITSVVPPTRTGHDFAGYFTESTGGVKCVDTDGSIVMGAFSEDIDLHAQWSVRSYTVTFHYNGGSGSVHDKTVTWGVSIGNLPTPTPPTPDAVFDGWVLGYETITSDTIWATDGDAVLNAKWRTGFGDVEDYFNFDGDMLMLVESSDGAACNAISTCGTAGSGANTRSGHLSIQNSNSSVGAFSQGGILLNPTCKYRIRKRGTVEITLGKAFGKAAVVGSGTASNPIRVTKSGYMLVEAEYDTAADGEPILVLRGAANEGYVCNTSVRKTPELTDAINTWHVSLPVSPDHVAQDPFNAVAGGGELVECKTIVTCTPVVPVENGMPCASDAVRGKITVSARTCAYFLEAGPQTANQFYATNGTPGECMDTDFMSYSMIAERSL